MCSQKTTNWLLELEVDQDNLLLDSSQFFWPVYMDDDTSNCSKPNFRIVTLMRESQYLNTTEEKYKSIMLMVNQCSFILKNDIVLSTILLFTIMLPFLYNIGCFFSI